MRASVLLAELKRRKVLRVAAVYGATAFAILQAVEIVFPRLDLPDWTITLVVALALVGLPMVLVLTWAFESTPEGMRRTAPAEPEELEAILAQPVRRRWATAFAALAGIVLLAAGAVWSLGLRGGDGEPGYDSIAVLPFLNLSGDPQNEYFGDGLAEELLNALSGIPGLKVAARTSAFAFKGTNTDIRVIADTLHVATVLEGSVRRDEDRIRITAQLIDARTGYHLWSETYDRPLSDLFSVQDAIAGEITRALAGRLAAESGRTLYLGGTEDVAAYDLYLLGRQQWATREIPLLREAVRNFEGAIACDSSFALAWSGLADAIDALAWRAADERHLVPAGRYAALRAVALEPALAEAWASVAVFAMDFDRDFAMAELALHRAIALKPSYSVAYNWLADAQRYSGRVDEAMESSSRAILLDPLNGGALTTHIDMLQMKGRYSEARAVADRLLGAGYRDRGLYLLLIPAARAMGYGEEEVVAFTRGWALAVGTGRPEELALIGRATADASLRPRARELIRSLVGGPGRARDLAIISISVGDLEGAVAYLVHGFEEGDPNLVAIGTSPAYDPLRSDPGFVRIVEALGLPNGR